MKNCLLMSFVFLALAIQAQNTRPVCGMSAADQFMYDERLLANLADVEAGIVDDRGGTKYVPVHFHLVGDASGNGKARELKVLEQLCALNTAYASIGIQFYLSAHPTYGLFDKSINSETVYTTQTNNFLMQTRRHPNAINYYIVNEAASGNNDPGLALAYYSGAQDWIVSRKDRINGNASNSTIPHETGHFFSLDHPFLGWESTTGFRPGYPGWPIAPVMAPDGGFAERQDGSNCTIAADRICDTGPDYKFGFTQSDCSPYSQGAKDPVGTLVDPMENNTMSYFEACSLYLFTPLQSSVMLADLNRTERNYLDNTYSPVATSIDTPTDLLTSPENAATAQFYNAVLLEWKSVAGATHYAIEVDDLPSFLSPNLKSYITQNTSYLLTNLNPNDSYYWRVKPFNASVGCATPRSRNLKTSSIASKTFEIEGLTAWQISPNPASDQVNITVSADAAFEAQVTIVDAAGKTVVDMPGQNFESGQSTLPISLQGLSKGFYFVHLFNGEAHDVRKLVVLR